jgi:hypothetical protein
LGELFVAYYTHKSHGLSLSLFGYQSGGVYPPFVSSSLSARKKKALELVPLVMSSHFSIPSSISKSRETLPADTQKDNNDDTKKKNKKKIVVLDWMKIAAATNSSRLVLLLRLTL